MGKTGLKTFVCSFTFSLFAFVGAGKELFSISPNTQDNIIIPNKNISLFIKGIDPQTVSSKTAPIKKIALSAPLVMSKDEVKEPSTNKANDKQPSVEEKDFIPLTFAENNIEIISEAQKEFSEEINDIKSKSNKMLDNEPKKIAQNFQDFKTHKPDISEIKVREAEELPSNAEEINFFANKTLEANVQIIRPNAKNVDKFLSSNSQQDTSKTEPKDDFTKKSEEKIPLQDTKNSDKSHQEETHVIAMVPDNTLEDETKNKDTSAPIVPAFKVASAKPNPDIQAPIKRPHSKVSAPHREPKNLLIPLEITEKSSGENSKIISSPQGNKLAMLNSKAPIHSMEETFAKETTAQQTNDTSSWQTMAQKRSSNESAWVAAKGKGYIPNDKLKEEKFFKSAQKEDLKILKKDINLDKPENEIKLASEMVDNLLIPIPDDILNDPNLTPQLVSSAQNKDLEEKVTQQENSTHKSADKSLTSAKAAVSSKEDTETEDKSLFKSLTSIFKKSNSTKANDNEDEGFFDSVKKSIKKAQTPSKILPTEIRLAFQPNRAEISGVTLKWLQAFANKINEDRNAGLEIRIDGSSSYELQQKRLNLLNNILASNGVDFNKVNTIFTTREPNSFIIRTVRINNANGGIEENNDWQDYYKVW